jgi:hypothetical protein
VSEYTPSTDEVFDSYHIANEGRQTIAQSLQEFDRWLSGVRSEAWDEGRRAGDYPLGRPTNGFARNPYI